MSHNRRDFLQSFGSGAATLGLGGMTLSPRSTNTGDAVSSPEQILEVSQNGAIVETRSGKVRGYRRNGIYTYKGIPYGGPTSGKNRFMGPTPPQPWTAYKQVISIDGGGPADGQCWAAAFFEFW